MKVLQIAQGHTAAEPGLGLHPLLSHNKASTVYDGVSGSPRQGPKSRFQSRSVALQASLSMGLSRQEYWSGLPCLSPEDLPDPGVEPRSPASQADSLPTGPPEKVFLNVCLIVIAMPFSLCI